jgi:hypothetical protein
VGLVKLTEPRITAVGVRVGCSVGIAAGGVVGVTCGVSLGVGVLDGIGVAVNFGVNVYKGASVFVGIVTMTVGIVASRTKLHPLSTVEQMKIRIKEASKRNL